MKSEDFFNSFRKAVTITITTACWAILAGTLLWITWHGAVSVISFGLPQYISWWQAVSLMWALNLIAKAIWPDFKK